MPNSITLQWIERANYDFETARAMLKASRYLYVAFACQQAVEKYLKAIIQEKTGQIPPYTHNLLILSKLSELEFNNEQQDFFAILSQYYLNTRYIDFKQRLLDEMDNRKAKECLQKTEVIIKCLKSALKI